MLNEKQFNEITEFYNIVDYLDLEINYNLYKDYINFKKNITDVYIAYRNDCKKWNIYHKFVAEHDLFNYYLKGGF